MTGDPARPLDRAAAPATWSPQFERTMRRIEFAAALILDPEIDQDDIHRRLAIFDCNTEIAKARDTRHRVSDAATAVAEYRFYRLWIRQNQRRRRNIRRGFLPLRHLQERGCQS